MPPVAWTWVAVALAALAGPVAREPSLPGAIGLLAGGFGAWGLALVPVRAARYALAAAVASALALLAASPSAALGPWGRWFSPMDGLVYENPVIWLGLAGGFSHAGRVSAAAGLFAAATYAMTSPSSLVGAALAAATVALLVPALAAALARLSSSAERRPLVWLGAAGVALSVWNLLFMEQYRRNLIPRDDTVSFVDVARTNARLFEQAFGPPATWPASWIFAARHGAPAAYGTVAARSWQLETDDAENLDVPVASAPVFVALRTPRMIDVTCEAVGGGTLELLVNGRLAATIPVSAPGGEARARVDRSFWRRGVNELRLEPSAPAVTVRRLIVRRSGGTA